MDDYQVLGHYLCIEDVPLYRGGDFLCAAFAAGQSYPLVGWEYQDAILINDSGGPHLMPPKMLSAQFRKKEQV